MRSTRYNPLLQRHSWTRLREHVRECAWCSITVENHEPATPRGQWRKSWVLVDGTEGDDRPSPGPPACLGPVWLHLGDVCTGSSVHGRRALIAAAELVGSLGAAELRSGAKFADHPRLERSVNAVLVARKVADLDPMRTVAGHRYGTVEVSRRLALDVARVVAEAVDHWTANSVGDGEYAVLARVGRTVVLDQVRAALQSNSPSTTQ